MHLDYETIICTCNGELYIEEQLCSVLNQNPLPRAIWVSDDGSTDKTGQIVAKISHKSATPIHWIDGPRQGVARNVFSALRRTAARYVFIADQDDIWLEDKVSLFTEAMYTPNDDRSILPHLIFSDAWVWHPPMDTRKSFWKTNNINPDNAARLSHTAFYNGVQGASSCVNRAMIDAIKNHEDVIMHDWWMTLIAASVGTITYIKEPTMLYRQHGKNLVGSGQPTLRRIMKTRSNISQTTKQIEAFRDQYSDKLRNDRLEFFTDFHECEKKGPLAKLAFLRKHKIRHKTPIKTVALWAGYLTK